MTSAGFSGAGATKEGSILRGKSENRSLRLSGGARHEYVIAGFSNLAFRALYQLPLEDWLLRQPSKYRKRIGS